MFHRWMIAATIPVMGLLTGGCESRPAKKSAAAPFTVTVEATYPGASPGVLADTVAAPIEQQVNGVENALHLKSHCGPDGKYTLVATFKAGTDPAIAQVLVQNRATLALPVLPDLGIFHLHQLLYAPLLNAGTDHPSLYPTAANPISLTAPLYTDVGTVPHKGNLYGVNGYLQNFTGLDNGMPHVRHKQLYFVISGFINLTGTGTLAGDRSAILWYRFNLTGDPTGQGKGIETMSTVPALVQSGVIFDPTVTATPINYWNGAIMTDKDNNIAIIGNSAGEDDYIQAFYTGRKPNDPPGTLQPLSLLRENNASYNFGTLLPSDANSERWGDYCSLNTIPATIATCGPQAR